MHVIAVCDMLDLETMRRIIDYTPEIDSYSYIDPRVFDVDSMPNPSGDIVIALVNSMVANVSVTRKILSVLKHFEDNGLDQSIVVSLGGPLPADFAYNHKHAFVLCVDKSDLECVRTSQLITELMAEYDLQKGVGRKGYRRRHKTASKSMYLHLLRRFPLLLLSLFALVCVALFRNEIWRWFNLSLPFPLNRFAYAALCVLLSLAVTVMCTYAISPCIRAVFELISNTKHRDERREAIEYSRRLRSVVEGDQETTNNSGIAAQGRLNALERMLINLEDIKQYYTWSQDQARSAFRLACALCIAGFIFMVAAISLPILLGLEWQTAVIPAIGAALSELLAGTVLLVYRHSLVQLNRYHDVLHEDERFLSSISLIDKFSTQEKRDEVLMQIVQSELEMNLASARSQLEQTPNNPTRMTNQSNNEGKS